MWQLIIICMSLICRHTLCLDFKPKSCSSIEIVNRKEWKARPPVRSSTMPSPLSTVIIEHTVTGFCNYKMSCIREVQFMQEYHLDFMGWWDLGYSFLIGGDGRVYEARGWKHAGAHSINFNKNSLGIAFIGNFNHHKPKRSMIEAAINLLDCGVKMGYLTPAFEVHGHRDVACTESPGNHIYQIIRKWKNFKGGRMPKYNCDPTDPHKDLKI